MTTQRALELIKLEHRTPEEWDELGDILWLRNIALDIYSLDPPLFGKAVDIVIYKGAYDILEKNDFRISDTYDIYKAQMFRECCRKIRDEDRLMEIYRRVFEGIQWAPLSWRFLLQNGSLWMRVVQDNYERFGDDYIHQIPRSIMLVKSLPNRIDEEVIDYYLEEPRNYYHVALYYQRRKRIVPLSQWEKRLEAKAIKGLTFGLATVLRIDARRIDGNRNKMGPNNTKKYPDLATAVASIVKHQYF